MRGREGKYVVDPLNCLVAVETQGCSRSLPHHAVSLLETVSLCMVSLCQCCECGGRAVFTSLKLLQRSSPAHPKQLARIFVACQNYLVSTSHADPRNRSTKVPCR